MKPPEEVDGDHDLLAVFGAALRQRPERGPLGVDAAAVAGVAAADQRVNEAAVIGEAVEVARAAEQQGILEGALQVTVSGLDRTVLVGDAAVVAAGGHAVMVAKRAVADGPVLIHLRREVAEGGREAVAAVLPRCAAEGPERVPRRPAASATKLSPPSTTWACSKPLKARRK
jgi:hypothetical protein